MPSRTRSTHKNKLLPYAAGLLQGDRSSLAQAITLVESNREKDRQNAQHLVEAMLPHSGRSIRLGITGSPGVGKSTFIEAFGKHLTSLGKKVAVLAIDPSSKKTRGSILGDKTRMEDLSKDPLAFIRPSPSGESVGGVTWGTRESIILCEAAGYDVIIVETVGVGQSDVSVRGMVDFFLLLMLAGAGDELQGIKKGIMEMADGIAITKADGDNMARSTQAQADFKHALHLFQPAPSGWKPRVLTTSAITKKGISEVWEMIETYRNHTVKNDFLYHQRNQQNLEWFHAIIHARITDKLLGHSKKTMASLAKKVSSNLISPLVAAQQIVTKFKL